jgi:hypothetical protein
MPRIGRRQMSGFFTQNLTTFAGLPIGSAVIRDELDDDSFKGCCQGNERSSLGLAKMPLKVAIVSRPRPGSIRSRWAFKTRPRLHRGDGRAGAGRRRWDVSAPRGALAARIIGLEPASVG